jgi:hydrogenase maturation protease
MWINPSSPEPGRTVVIGLGNPLMGDDGLGLAALERLRAAWSLPAAVVLVDGGTWGMSLLPEIEDADRLLLLDAIDVGAQPGTLHVLQRDQIPRYLATKISPHEVDLRDVLALAELRGTLPRETVAVGLQPAAVELSSEISAPIRARLDDCVAATVRQLEQWGLTCQPAAAPAPAHA